MFLQRDKMKTLFCSSDLDIINEWKMRNEDAESADFDNCTSLLEAIKELDEYIVIVDYDTLSQEINKLIAAKKLPERVIVLEKVPEVITGKMLISKGVKAYGNARMLKIHYKQMINAVANNKIWTYPELTLALTKNVRNNSISPEAENLIEHRLTEKEKEVVYAILEGLTNDAIASELDITQRTVKAHISSIFSKLHVNDRVSLILLLR